MIEFTTQRQQIIIPGDTQKTISFCARYFLEELQKTVTAQGYFAVALSGGNTPKEIFNAIAADEQIKKLPWEKVFLFWSDERCVPQDHPDSNYGMAMKSGLGKLPIPKDNIHPMKGIGNLEENAKEYEALIRSLPKKRFDLVMLGMGEDGHTASLFPNTTALYVKEHLVVPNFLPEKKQWRMTLTFDCINASKHIFIHILGKSKASMVNKALFGSLNPEVIPIQNVGTQENKAIWVLDQSAASEID